MYFFYYIPVGLDIARRRRSIVTYFLAGLSVVLYFIYRYIPYGPFWNLDNLIFLPAYPRIVGAITYVFLHGGYLHLVGNVVYLVLFGRVVEDRFGPVRFAAVFVLSAVIGAYMHLYCVRLFAPSQVQYGVIGASGATSGLLGAFLVRFYYSRVRIAYWIFMPLQGINRAGRTHVPVFFAVVLWILLQTVNALLQFGGGLSGVAYALHIGGFATGAALAVLFGSLSAARAERSLARARRYFEEANWFGAQGEYINYLDRRPNDAAAHAEAARAFICGQQSGPPRVHYRESVRLLLERGDRSGAEAIFTEAMRQIADFTLDEVTHLNLAYGMERTLKFHAAHMAYGNFVRVYPASCDAPFVLLRMAGLLEKRFLRCDEAYGCYKRVVESYPDDTWIDYARSEMDRLEAGPETSEP